MVSNRPTDAAHCKQVPLTLDEWVMAKGFERLREQWLCHFGVYGHEKEEAERLARLCMSSLRDAEREES